jgi:multicomponent K+:H+ antiporter subunit E
MIRRILPHPVLSLVVALIWMLLVNRFAWGSLVFALMLGLVVPLVTVPYWPDRPRMRKPLRMLPYIGIVIHDIVKANIDVARIVLFMPNRQLRPAWLVVPLEVDAPEAIAVLMGTITLTPGTVSCDLAEDGRSLLVHALHCPDPEGTVAEIRERYEARLKEIFP